MAPPAPVAACIELIKARPGTQAVLLGGHGVLAFGPDAEATVSLLVALEEAAEAELRTAVLGRLSAPPGTLHIWGMAAGERCAMVAGYPGARGDDHVDAYSRAGPAWLAAASERDRSMNCCRWAIGSGITPCAAGPCGCSWC